MAKNETTMYKDPKASVTGGQKSSLPRAVVDKMKGKSSLPQSVVDKMRGKRDLETMKTRIGAVVNKYRSPIGPSNKGSVPGGAGITALNSVRMKPTAKAPKATVSAGTAVPATATVRKTTTINIPGGGLPTSGGAKSAKTTSSKMAVNPRTGDTTGFTTGKTTGSTSTKSGTAGKTSTSASQRAANNAFNKGGVAGPRGSRM